MLTVSYVCVVYSMMPIKNYFRFIRCSSIKHHPLVVYLYFANLNWHYLFDLHTEGPSGRVVRRTTLWSGQRVVCLNDGGVFNSLRQRNNPTSLYIGAFAPERSILNHPDHWPPVHILGGGKGGTHKGALLTYVQLKN